MAGETTRNPRQVNSADTIELIKTALLPTLTETSKAVSEIKVDIGIINNRLTNIEYDTKSVDEIIKTFRVTLYGNGNPDQGGLITVVAKLKAWVDARSAIEKSVIAGLVLAVFGEVAGFVYIALRLQAIH